MGETPAQMIQRDHNDQAETDYAPTAWDYARIGAPVLVVMLWLVLWDGRKRRKQQESSSWPRRQHKWRRS